MTCFRRRSNIPAYNRGFDRHAKREREREREREWERERARAREGERRREGERVTVCVSEKECERVYVRDTTPESGRKGERKSG